MIQTDSVLHIVEDFFTSLENLIAQIPLSMIDLINPESLPPIVEKWVQTYYKKWNSVLALQTIDHPYYGIAFRFVTKNQKEYIFPWLILQGISTPKNILYSLKHKILKDWKSLWTWQDLVDRILDVYINYGDDELGYTPFTAESIRYLLQIWDRVPHSISSFEDGWKDPNLFKEYHELYYPKFTYRRFRHGYYNNPISQILTVTTFRPQMWKLKGIIQRTGTEDTWGEEYLINNKFDFGVVYHGTAPRLIISWFNEKLSRRHPLHNFQIKAMHYWLNFNHLKPIHPKQKSSNFTWNLLPFSEYHSQYMLQLKDDPEQLIQADWELIRSVNDSQYPDSEEMTSILNKEYIRKENNRYRTGWNPFIELSKKYPKSESYKIVSDPLYTAFARSILLRRAPTSIPHVLWVEFTSKIKSFKDNIIPMIKSWTFRGVIYEMNNAIMVKFYAPSTFKENDLLDIQSIFENNRMVCEIYTGETPSTGLIKGHNLPPAKYFDDNHLSWNFR